MAVQASQEGAAEYYPHGLVSLTQEHRMADTVKRLGKVRVEPLQASRFIRPASIYFEMDGKSGTQAVTDAFWRLYKTLIAPSCLHARKL